MSKVRRSFSSDKLAIQRIIIESDIEVVIHIKLALSNILVHYRSCVMILVFSVAPPRVPVPLF